MSTVTELRILKACVESPIVISNLKDLNLMAIPDPLNADSLNDDEYYQKKALRLFNMAWSGITKSLSSICALKKRPVEFPHFGIFVPFVAASS